MWNHKVRIKKPYNYMSMLERLATDPLVSVRIEQASVKVPIPQQNKIATVSFSESNDQVSAFIESSGEKDTVLHRLSQIFWWERDLQRVADHFTETKLSTLFDCFFGTPLVSEFEEYGCLMKTIIHQQLNLKFAHTLTLRFVHTYGEQKDGVWFYPTPEIVSYLTVEELRNLQFSERKAQYVIDTSRLIIEGKLDLQSLPEKEDEEIIEELMKIRGIGRWTAENYLMFALGRMDHLPAADIGIQNAMKSLYQLKQKPTKDEIIELATTWTPFRTYAALYLWLSIERPQYVQKGR
ncbi:DNA-3-methyladenine glycosylase family protein [Bacillus alkalicellulosilyticus]|uniref:DNA-3-methyladenine glycosylase family protein n=1 Tax=Alkalihalobacterium alkalicellulosilyticum TaxID=1912214 RepID=UPI000998A0EC|nr:DNA-3-methyladenine glycosylase [Bacillus alkalicellulosilyticus]